MIKVLLFAGIAEKMGQQQLVVEQHGITVQDLRKWLTQQYPEITIDLERAMIAVNEEFADDQTLLKMDDEIAIIPPVSGG
jgi:molybdopterin synthase sulfur carrier subunit